MKHIGIVDITTIGATICANEIVAVAHGKTHLVSILNLPCMHFLSKDIKK